MDTPKKKYNYKEKTGRPDKYNPKFLKVMDEYLAEAVPENMDIPTVEGFALKIDVSDRALYRWSKKYPEFRHALRKLKITQKQHLLRTGIFGGKEINPQIIALALRVNHKMVETTKSESKSDITSNGKTIKWLNDNNDTVSAPTTSAETTQQPN